MTKKEKELMDMMQNFKKLNPKEQGFIFGLSEGMLICKSNSIKEDYDCSKSSIHQIS